MSIPHTHLGTSGPLLSFLHANGYPPLCYRPLLDQYADNYRVVCMHQRPLWIEARPQDISSWLPLTTDFLQFLDETGSEPLIGVGHSVGGIVTLRAALQQPERFRALVLIDPVLFPPWVIHIWKVIRFLRLSYQLHPLIRSTINRRNQFDDLERLFNGYRHKPVFKYMDDLSLRAYIEGIACSDGQGYHLCYSADWEMRIYATSIWKDMDIWNGLPGLKVPLLILRGAETNTFWESTGQRVLRRLPTAKIITIPQSTHLVALERPGQIFQATQQFLMENL